MGAEHFERRLSAGVMHRLAPTLELFSRQRRLNYPVEFYVMPEVRNRTALNRVASIWGEFRMHGALKQIAVEEPAPC